jgi:hypothetical protein
MSEDQKKEVIVESRTIARKLAREISLEELESISGAGVSCSCCRADDCCQY